MYEQKPGQLRPWMVRKQKRVGRPFFEALLFLLSACQPVSALQIVGSQGTLEIVRKPPLLELEPLRSAQYDYLSAATLELNPGGSGCTINGIECSEPAARIRSAIAEAGARAPALRYGVDGGAALPLDTDTLALFSLAAHLEDADAHFASLGFAVPPHAPVYFAAQTTGLFSFFSAYVDNAAYFGPIDAFVVFPLVRVSGLPLSTNRGILFHEMHHRVLSWTLEPSAGRPYAGPETSGSRRLRSVDEGIADYFGYVGAGDPQFFRRSIDTARTAERNLDEVKDFDATWLEGELPLVSGAFNPYAAGAVFAHVLYRASLSVPSEDVQRACLHGEAALAGRDVSTLRYGAMLDAIVAAASPAAASALCSELRLRAAPVVAEMSQCP